MKKTLLQAIVGFLGLTAIGILVFFLLVAFGLIAVTISPIYSYRLNPDESVILDSALKSLHEKMARGDYESLADDLIEARISKAENIRKMRAAQNEFGNPTESEFFRSSWPEPASRYYPDIDGTIYTVLYFTKGSTSEYFEHIDWIINQTGQPRIRAYSASEIVDWQVKSREEERERAQTLDDEIRIPIGNRFIEVHY